LHTIWRPCPGLAAQLTASSKKGLNAHQLHRMLGTNCETAWFLFHRLRGASKDVACSGVLGESRTVEADETHVDGEETNKHAHKRGKVGGGKGGNLAAYPLKGVHLVTDEIEDPRSILLANQIRFFRGIPRGNVTCLKALDTPLSEKVSNLERPVGQQSLDWPVSPRSHQRQLPARCLRKGRSK